MCSSIKNVTIFSPRRETALVPSCSVGVRVNSAAQSSDTLRIARSVDKGALGPLPRVLSNKNVRLMCEEVSLKSWCEPAESKKALRDVRLGGKTSGGKCPVQLYRGVTGGAGWTERTWAYRQTSCAWWRTWSSCSGCCFPPSSQSPVCSAGWGSPPFPACSRCIPEDRSAGAHLQGGGGIDNISFTAGGPAYLTAESSLWSKRCDWATFITEPIKGNQAGTNGKG